MQSEHRRPGHTRRVGQRPRRHVLDAHVPEHILHGRWCTQTSSGRKCDGGTAGTTRSVASRAVPKRAANIAGSGGGD